ncbi:GNS1/SUR4 family-domain-containing protein [Jimgerdemannia flammicorona]|uniref:Elongation of fatty acids protein n=2 Tax=Jimgerdemannia flammicorona TaxID=994334 RepID=A0A433QIA8_9FUNG|nr:GNS1/SUR4 family-domain-containing protein [Jimgerdemannia flammicorona]RUS29533.1 GNS1/SUR4 family-domain-containing protein [Jimgerdemannia flammicorona]
MQNFTFSPEQPFGLNLFSTFFEPAYKAVTGNDATAFHYVEDISFGSTNAQVIGTCIVYYITIFGGQALMTNMPAFKLNFLFQVHNALLTLASGALLILFIEQVSPILWHQGVLSAFCHPESWTQKLELLYYLNYLVKYWELLDTVFLFLKKKQLEFLHYFHHSMTMALCYVQLNGRTSVSWVPIILNLTVHVFMYYYYFRTASGARIWWKKYLTTMQIVQFIIDLVIIYFCSYTYFAATYFPYFPNAGTCAGTETSAIAGCSLLSSYLLLFINFYHQTYKAKTRGAANVKAKAL